MLKKGDEVEVLSGCRKGSRGFVVKDYKPGEMLRVEFADKIIHYTEAGLRRLAKVERFHDETTVTFSNGSAMKFNDPAPAPRIHGTWLTPDVDWFESEYTGDVEPEDMEEALPPKSPCRCPSLLKGHEQHCEWHPSYGRLLTDEERERQRLENVWGLLRAQQPREPLSYKTTMDTVGGNASRQIQKMVKLAEAYGAGPEGIKKLLGGLK